jgi:hypothetical protein
MKSFRVVLTAFVATVAVGPVASAYASQDVPKPTQVAANLAGLHDFDFLVGEWQTHSRKLKERLNNSKDWLEFDGTLRTTKLMDGLANVDDTFFNVTGGSYRGVALRSYDPKTGQWVIWWLDGRNPSSELDEPVRGKFANGVGTFYADDRFQGKPIRVRFLWSHITATSARWEQAFSPDDGNTWETNWIQEIRRMP